MDLLFHRYASPLVLLDAYLASGRFAEFVNEVITLTNEETENDTLWEFFLHKVFDQSWGEFMKSTKRIEPVQQEIDFETTIQDSAKMLEAFSPE